MWCSRVNVLTIARTCTPLLITAHSSHASCNIRLRGELVWVAFRQHEHSHATFVLILPPALLLTILRSAYFIDEANHPVRATMVHLLGRLCPSFRDGLC